VNRWSECSVEGSFDQGPDCSSPIDGSRSQEVLIYNQTLFGSKANQFSSDLDVFQEPMLGGGGELGEDGPDGGAFRDAVVLRWSEGVVGCS
jgi:hypothetical protein